jgi:hypothetical protein
VPQMGSFSHFSFESEQLFLLQKEKELKDELALSSEITYFKKILDLEENGKKNIIHSLQIRNFIMNLKIKFQIYSDFIFK